METQAEYSTYLDAMGDLATIADSALSALLLDLGSFFVPLLNWALKPLDTDAEKAYNESA